MTKCPKCGEVIYNITEDGKEWLKDMGVDDGDKPIIEEAIVKKIKGKCQHYKNDDEGFYCWKCLAEALTIQRDYYEKEMEDIREGYESELSQELESLRKRFVAVKQQHESEKKEIITIFMKTGVMKQAKHNNTKWFRELQNKLKKHLDKTFKEKKTEEKDKINADLIYKKVVSKKGNKGE